MTVFINEPEKRDLSRKEHDTYDRKIDVQQEVGLNTMLRCSFRQHEGLVFDGHVDHQQQSYHHEYHKADAVPPVMSYLSLFFIFS